MWEEELTRDDVAGIIEEPDRVLPGRTADEYFRTIRGTLYRAIVVKDSDPPLVITVHEVYREGIVMLVEFDPEGDTLFIKLRAYRGHMRGTRVDEYRTIMIDDEDQPVAVELYFVNQGINLSGLPCADEIAAALKAFPRAAA